MNGCYEDVFAQPFRQPDLRIAARCYGLLRPTLGHPMSTTIDSVISDLQDFEPDGDASNDIGRLYEILTDFELLPHRERAVAALFGVIERFPEYDFGSPGPLVHTLEAIPGYEPFLMESLRRVPAELSVWMVNRILNSDLPSEANAFWVNELRQVLTNPAVLASARESAKEFLEYQGA